VVFLITSPCFSDFNKSVGHELHAIFYHHHFAFVTRCISLGLLRGAVHRSRNLDQPSRRDANIYVYKLLFSHVLCRSALPFLMNKFQPPNDLSRRSALPVRHRLDRFRSRTHGFHDVSLALAIHISKEWSIAWIKMCWTRISVPMLNAICIFRLLDYVEPVQGRSGSVDRRYAIVSVDSYHTCVMSLGANGATPIVELLPLLMAKVTRH
jgi:hypothetical protein